jgi:hypothetical protein
LTFGERLLYHKRDWPGLGDSIYRGSYQQSDSVPLPSRYASSVVQTCDFGGAPRHFGQFDAGDGGQVAFFTADTAPFGITQDGGADLQFFIGQGCQPVDFWILSTSASPPS